jgi:hypothetical protein
MKRPETTMSSGAKPPPAAQSRDLQPRQASRPPPFPPLPAALRPSGQDDLARRSQPRALCFWTCIAIAICSLVSGATLLSAQNAGKPANGMGPDIVMLDELVEHYQPVPFDHRTHAEMAEMWDGCVLCHHHTPMPADVPEGQPLRRQELAAAIPACKSCHAISDKGDDLHMPNLKGAYHRQCLGCHREWAGENQCQACHEPLDPSKPRLDLPTPAGIVSRMCPPIPEPDELLYRTRFTPAVGSNVLFRHKQHTDVYGVRCVSCHVRENCTQCHTPSELVQGPRPMERGRTWSDSHKPCSNCHETDRCATCHFGNYEPAPPTFDHQRTAQLLDSDHAELKCVQCHLDWREPTTLTCGDSTCHQPGTVVAYPEQRPGPVIEQPHKEPEIPYGPVRLILESQRRGRPADGG